MATDDGSEHPSESRIKELLDRLAELLRELPPDRQKAFQEYLDEQIEKEGDDGGDNQESDRG